MVEQSNWGGRRAGAGRKAGEGSTRVSVPNGCLDVVLQLIADYRQGHPVQIRYSVTSDLDQVEMDFSLNESSS